ncbi:MAG: DUF1127 domain-containing protein [Sulfitobacter sp.]
MTSLVRRNSSSSLNSTNKARSIVDVIARAYGLWCSRRALARLTAAQLQDVGVSPSEARNEANRPVWDVPANWRD